MKWQLLGLATLVVALGAQGLQSQSFLAQEKFVPAPPELPTSGGYHAVSTTMKCVINLTLQYMIIYSALAVSRTCADAFGWEFKTVPVANILNQCTNTINYCPMCACMFLAIRMRVIWLSRGAEWDPQDWVCVCMQYVTWSILATTLVVALIPLFTGELVAIKNDTGDLDPDATPGVFKGNWALALGFTVFRYILLASLYGGMIGVIYGAFSYMPANGEWRPMAPAVGATVTLTIMFFLVYIGVAVLRERRLAGSRDHPARGNRRNGLRPDALDPLPGGVDACAPDGSGEWLPSGLGEELLLHVRVRSDVAEHLLHCASDREGRDRPEVHH